MSQPPGTMLSFRRYGYRMIGAASVEDRFDYMRARSMGASAPAFGPLSYAGPSGTLAGESFVPSPANLPPAPTPVKRQLNLHLGPAAPPPAAPAPVKKTLDLHLGPSITAAPATTDGASLVTTSSDGAALAPAPAAGATCPNCGEKMAVAAVVGAVAGSLLMYFVGLATRESKKKKRRK